MVSVLTLSAVDHGFEPRSGQTKDHNISILEYSIKESVQNRSWVGFGIMCPIGETYLHVNF